MKKIFIVLGVLSIIGLLVLNIFLTIRNREEQNKEIKRAISSYQAVDEEKTANMVSSAIQSIQVIQGSQGSPGVPGQNGNNGKDGTSGKDGVNGKDGQPGAQGPKGESGHQVVLSTDPKTGDILWKYDDDTLWTVLVEKCELTETCE